ncbi:hypothetical protein GCM10023153_23760 [Ornithinibacter aureus]|uniref:Uncharacterized protein n=1 Tax=Ornithinibacter aureus TaxID=622664 RepID=A0ABP8K011_9MICO|nr:hypothetical protein [Ornithinibacter aureus]KAF0834265.1 hypothetical protein C8E84_2081 [Ornithinibacter aureus]
MLFANAVPNAHDAGVSDAVYVYGELDRGLAHDDTNVAALAVVDECTSTVTEYPNGPGRWPST